MTVGRYVLVDLSFETITDRSSKTFESLPDANKMGFYDMSATELKHVLPFAEGLDVMSKVIAHTVRLEPSYRWRMDECCKELMLKQDLYIT